MTQWRNGAVLQLSDAVSTRECSLRLEPGDVGLPLRELLNRYVKRAPSKRLLRESRITDTSADILFSLGDFVYASDDCGQLRDMFAGIAFTDGGRPIGLDDAPAVHHIHIPSPSGGGLGWGRSSGQEVALLDVGIDRIACEYDRNWRGFHARRWRRAPERYAAFVRGTLAADYGEDRADSVMELRSTEHKLKFLKSLARRIWNSRFENYSRFVGRRLVYKSGDETIDNILDGGGAICSEKVQALKFLTDHYGFESEYVLAGQDADGPFPAEKLRELLATFDFSLSKRYMRYWQHTALLYRVDGVRVLVDATNGNVPFLFLENAAADRLLRCDGKASLPVRMVESEEQFYYHETPQDIPENLFFALEGWIPFSDLMQVFDNELGLFLSADYYVTPISYRSEREYRRDREEFLEVCRRGGLEHSITEEWTLDTLLGRAFAEAEPGVSRRILDAREHLMARLNECDGPGHEAGLVIIRLNHHSLEGGGDPIDRRRGFGFPPSRE